jgi:hypothetical protein
METFAILIGEVSTFLGKKSKWEDRKCSFNDVLHPTALCDETVDCRISLYWTNCIQDRNNWKLYVEKAKTFKD